MSRYDIYGFEERRFTTFSHSIAIYIHGTEVASWLKGNLTINYANRDGFNTASFELENPKKIWQVTQDNLNGIFRETGDMFDERPKSDIFDLKNDPDNNPYFELDVTQAHLGAINRQKSSAQTDNLVSTLNSKNPFFPPSVYQERKYRLAVNDCIFNKNDFIRIFVKNPFSSASDALSAEWYEAFCGFVTEHPITTNHLTGESRVSISAACIKSQLQKMRVQVNVHLAGIDPAPLFDKGFYSDFISQGLAVHPFATSNLEDTIKRLILGTVDPSPDQKVTADEKKYKVGDFKLGNIICYDPANPGNTLERWHLMTIFGVNKVPFPKGGGIDDVWLKTSEMDQIGRATWPDKSDDNPVSPPTGRYLHMLLPLDGTGPSGLISYATINSANVADSREWSTRWEIIRDFASKMDFQVMTSPSGDILVEFPQYGFTPCAYLTNFGSTSTPGLADTATAAARKALKNPLNGTNTPTASPKAFPQCDVTLGSLANIFVFNLHQKEDTLNDEAEDFPNVIQVGGGVAFQPLNATVNTDALNYRAYIYSPALISRYGIVSESIDFPFAGQRASEIGVASSTTPKLTERLAQLGLMEFTKRMADASTWQGSLVYRPFLFPNRPIHLKKSARIGLLTGVSYTWAVKESASMNVSCHMLMAQRSDGSYRLLTGAVNTPIDYGAIWSEAPAGQAVAGSFVNQPTTTNVGAAGTGIVSANGSSNQTQAAAQQAKSTPDPNSNIITSPNVDLDNIFPPLLDLIKQLIAGCQADGLQVVATSGYRTPQHQAELHKSGIYSAETLKSFHVYGLAADIGLSGVTGQTDPRYDAIQRVNLRLKLGLDWGGYFSAKDKVHFQLPKAWKMNITQAMAIANSYRKPPYTEIGAIQKVWDALYASNPQLTNNNTSPPLGNAEDTKKDASVLIADALDPEEKQAANSLLNNPQTLGDLAPPKACSGSPLQTPDLKGVKVSGS